MARSRGRGKRGQAGHAAVGRDRGHRAADGHTQPEFVSEQPGEYWHEGEAQRYHTTPKAARVQAELTHSAAALAGLPCGPGIVLDLGCGGGLSSVTFHALAASNSKESGPPFVLGIDTSPAMLASTPSEHAVAGIRVPALGTESIDGDRGAASVVDISDGVHWRRSRGDVLLADLAQPLPLRRGVVDGVISISAVQWLIASTRSADADAESPKDASTSPPVDGPQVSSNGTESTVSNPPCRNASSSADGPEVSSSSTSAMASNRPGRRMNVLSNDASLGSTSVRKHEDTLVIDPPQFRLNCLFSSLFAVTTSGARLALQFYPPKGNPDYGARALRGSAQDAGFAAEVLLDFPHKGAAKKWILVAQSRSDNFSSDLKVENSSEGSPWCALCWPAVAAQCVLQQTVPPLERLSLASVVVRSRVEQQHLEVALRLARCGRRLLPGVTAGPSIAGDDDAEDVRTRLKREMHPLQVQLAVALADLLEGGAPPSPKRFRPTLDDDKDSAPAPDPPTKTELRKEIAARLPEVVAILHKAPDRQWTLPPPPLSASSESDGGI